LDQLKQDYLDEDEDATVDEVSPDDVVSVELDGNEVLQPTDYNN